MLWISRLSARNLKHFNNQYIYMSRGTAFLTRILVRSAKTQISLRIHAAWSETIWILGYQWSVVRTLWSDCTDAHAELSLCWTHRQYYRNCCVPAYITIKRAFTFSILHCPMSTGLNICSYSLITVNDHPGEKMDLWTCTKTQLSQCVHTALSIFAWRSMNSKEPKV